METWMIVAGGVVLVGLAWLAPRHSRARGDGGGQAGAKASGDHGVSPGSGCAEGGGDAGGGDGGGGD